MMDRRLIRGVLALWAGTAFAGGAAGADRLFLAGGDGPGKGRHIVLIAGDEEYRSEESLPMLAKILSRRHGFDCTVLFSWDPEGRFIDPHNQQGLRGLEALASADLLVVATRYRNPSPEAARPMTAYLNAGKPVIGLRTATHAFKGDGSFGGTLPYAAWGRMILGEQWVRHHGDHKKEGARAVTEPAHAGHPILRGVQDIFAPTDVYGVDHLTGEDTILLRGAVTGSLDPASKPVPGPKNQPMQPLAWLHPYTAPDGTTRGTAFCTTMGAAVDFAGEDLRRLVVNAACHLLGIDVPGRADVRFVDPFYPSFYGFIREPEYWRKLDLQPEDFGPGKAPHMPDPPGSPPWPWRPVP